MKDQKDFMVIRRWAAASGRLQGSHGNHHHAPSLRSGSAIKRQEGVSGRPADFSFDGFRKKRFLVGDGFG